MTPLPDEQPLSRRQLREQQRTTEPSAPTEPRSRRVSTSAPVAGGDIPDVDQAPPEPSLSTGEVAELEAAEAAGRQLTRRQSRDLERVRTASLGVITPEGAEEAQDADPVDAPASEPEAQDAEATPPEDIIEATQPATAKGARKNGKRKQASEGASRKPSFVPSSAAKAVAEPEIVDADIVNEDEADTKAAFELLIAPHPESAFGPAVTAQARNGDADGPQLVSGFGEAVLDGLEPAEKSAPQADEPFDQIIARGLEDAGNGVSTSSIILPVMPNSHPLTGPLSANGNVVVTGSIDLQSPMGSATGASDHFDKSDIDAMFDAEDEIRPATAGTPVSASKAVSTHTATRDVITPPAPARSNRLLLILAITAGVLAVAVLAVIIVGFAAGAFQSR